MFRYMKRHPFRLLGTLGLNFLGFALITATTILDQMLIDAVTEDKDNAFTFYLPLSLVGTLVAVALVVVAGVCCCHAHGKSGRMPLEAPRMINGRFSPNAGARLFPRSRTMSEI